ncbi:unnamed protein product [Protopolystoma xenopodis]|uniref:Uncharacterized protein n=1 Tax=Protopolystoma xenopodis TaxID=117903 RepID=A0A3S5BTE2_9PLAT|nr:unnamed protein product [Protopolystoma xenopodis]
MGCFIVATRFSPSTVKKHVNLATNRRRRPSRMRAQNSICLLSSKLTDRPVDSGISIIIIIIISTRSYSHT